MSKLHAIAAQRRLDVAEAKATVSLDQLLTKLRATEQEFGKPLSLAEKLRLAAPISGAAMHVAAEFKRASPSKGAIAEDDLKLVDQVEMYTRAGSSLVSVLTEPKWFKGTLDDMLEAKRTILRLFSASSSSSSSSTAAATATRALVLRKDFIVDEYQLYEAVAYGADTVLLIVAILPQDDELKRLIAKCRELGMEPLVEAANPAETERAIACGARVLGINNRDLTTFKLDLNTTCECAKVAANADVVLLALSGIKSREDVLLYEPFPIVRGILVGEHLMKCARPEREIRSLVVDAAEDDNSNGNDAAAAPRVLVKVCGVVREEDARAACQSKVDLMGLIFADKSPRRVSVEEAQLVAKCVRDFRESSARVRIDMPSSSSSSDEDADGAKKPKLNDASAAAWYQQGARALQRASRRGPLLVGVFQNQSKQFIEDVVRDVGLDLVQLHGNEPWSLCRELSVPAIKVVHIPHESALVPTDEQILHSCPPGAAIAVLLDTTVANSGAGGQQGGTGQAFDWSIAARYKELGLPVIVAGGLTPNNVRQAVRESGVPLAVDCSSGVQASSREKDPELIKRFVVAAKE